MEIFRLWGNISINKAAAIADMNAVNAHGSTIGTRLGNVFKTLGKVAVAGLAIATAAAAAIFVSAIKKAADFELAMAKVKAISGATADEFEALTEKAKQLGLDTAQTMTDVAAGMEAFARAGFTATEIVDAMSGAVALAESQTMALAEAVRITGAVLNGMNLEATESERVANALAAAASSSATTVDSLGEAMKYLAPVAAALNVPLEEALTIVGKLGDAGLTGGRATRALSTALEGLADPTAEAAEALEKLGIDTFDAGGNFIGITELVGQLEGAFNDLGYTAEERMAAMGAIFAGSAGEMNILISVGVEELERYQESITGTTIAFDQQAAMLDTLKGQWTILKGSVELLLVTIGTGMMPILKNLLKDHIIPIVNSITNWIDEQGGLLGVIDNTKKKIREWAEAHPLLISAVQSTWDVIKGLGSFIVNVFQGDWSDAWDDVKSVVKSAGAFIVDAVTTAWNALPISDEIKTKIVDAFIWIKDKAVEAWDGIEESVQEHAPGIIDAWNSIKESAGVLWDAIKDVFDSIMAIFGKTGEAAITFGDVVKGVFDVLLITVTTVMGGIADLFDIFAALLRGDWSQAWTDFKDFIAGIWEGIKNILDVTGLWDIGVRMAHAIRDGVSSAWDTVITWFQNAWDGLISALTSWMPGFLKTWLGIGEDSGKQYADGLESQKSNARDAGQDLGEAAVEGVKMSEAELEQAGTELAASFTSGFTGGVDAGKTGAFSSGTQLGEAAVSGLGFGIDAKSPSEKTYNLGLDFAEGFEDGIEEGTPAVVEAVETMAEMATTSLKDMWETAKSETKQVLGDMLNNIVTYYQEDEDAAEEHKKTLWEILKEGVRNLLTALREDLLLKAASHLVDAIALSFVPFMQPVAAGHLAASGVYAAGGAGLALAGFEKGGVFDSPTLLPPHMVAESGVSEAYLPLSKSVFAKIGDGIVNALSPQQPMLAGAGNISIDMRGMYDGATLNVRSESDIELIAREHYNLFQSRLRSEGVRT